MLITFPKHLPTIKEKIGVPENRAVDLTLPVDATNSEKIYKIKVKIKKSDLKSKINPDNLTYYN